MERVGDCGVMRILMITVSSGCVALYLEDGKAMLTPLIASFICSDYLY